MGAQPIIKRLATIAAKDAGIPLRVMFTPPSVRRGPRRVSHIRYAAMLVAREHGRSYGLIAKHLNMKDHTSALEGVRRALEFVAADPEYAALVGRLRAAVQ